MPYITRQDRLEIQNGRKAKTTGELNYLITKIVYEYIRSKGINYTNINEAIGVLECLKLELYRRVAAPYEDNKKLENGEVYIPEEQLKKE